MEEDFSKEFKSMFFKILAGQTANVFKVLNQTYSLHTWGKESREQQVKPREDGEVYSILAAEHCPVTYEGLYPEGGVKVTL